MKAALTIAIALVGCVSQPDDPKDSDISTVARCGQVPWMPHLAYAPDSVDPSRVSIDAKTWDAHGAWVTAVVQWSSCVSADVGTACGVAPQIPRWSYTPDVGRVLVDARVWDTHVTWTSAMSAWSECGEMLIESDHGTS